MSHGGVIAIVFALAHPDRVRTITLIEPPAFWMLPNHGYDDTGAREMQELLSSCAAARLVRSTSNGFDACSVTARVDARPDRHHSGRSG